jgi:hypothetical protein
VIVTGAGFNPRPEETPSAKVSPGHVSSPPPPLLTSGQSGSALSILEAQPALQVSEAGAVPTFPALSSTGGPPYLLATGAGDELSGGDPEQDDFWPWTEDSGPSQVPRDRSHQVSLGSADVTAESIRRNAVLIRALDAVFSEAVPSPFAALTSEEVKFEPWIEGIQPSSQPRIAGGSLETPCAVVPVLEGMAVVLDQEWAPEQACDAFTRFSEAAGSEGTGCANTRCPFDSQSNPAKRSDWIWVGLLGALLGLQAAERRSDSSRKPRI